MLLSLQAQGEQSHVPLRDLEWCNRNAMWWMACLDLR